MKFHNLVPGIVVAMGIQSCGRCALELSITNQSSEAQSIQIAMKNGDTTSVLIAPSKDSTVFIPRFDQTIIRFVNAVPDSTFETRDTDHWTAMIHKYSLIITKNAVRFLEPFARFYLVARPVNRLAG